jgi:phosphotransferase system HPr (HPr) family protein
MVTAHAKVKNGYGIHCRPSAIIVKESQTYSGTITVDTAGGRSADAKNMLAVIGLGLTCEDELTISVDGPDEQAVCDKLIKLFETEFDFER